LLSTTSSRTCVAPTSLAQSLIEDANKLSSGGWNPGRVGYALTFPGLVSVGFQTPAGAVIDSAHAKPGVVLLNLAVLTAGACILAFWSGLPAVYLAVSLIGFSGAFLGPSLAAITLGPIGEKGFDTQYSRNQAFNSAGNVFSAF
jgi:hypothetical protein